MNNFKGCVPCVCTTCSGRKRSCEEQNNTIPQIQHTGLRTHPTEIKIHHIGLKMHQPAQHILRPHQVMGIQ